MSSSAFPHATPPSAPQGFFIVVWAAGRETPVYACPSHAAAPTPSLSVVALYRFFTALALLSAAARNSEDALAAEQATLTCSTVRTGKRREPSLPCAFGSTALFHVAVLAASAESKDAAEPRDTEGLLRWIAAGLVRSLEPSAWQSLSSSSEKCEGSHLAKNPMVPPKTDPNFSARLSRYWEAESAATVATTTAMESYGVHEVLGEGCNHASSLSTLLDATHKRQEGGVVSPVGVAVQTYLERWWLPFVSPQSGRLPRLHLAGYFAVTSALASVAAETCKPPRSACPPLFAPFGYAPACTEAIRLLSALCPARPLHPSHCTAGAPARPASAASSNLTDVLVARQDSSTALIAIDMGIIFAGQARFYQVAVVSDISCISKSAVCIHRVDAASTLEHQSTLWCHDLLRAVC